MLRFCVISWLVCLICVTDLSAAVSSSFSIDTDITTTEPLSTAFEIDTRGVWDPDGGAFSVAFIIDTRGESSLDLLSAAFTIDTRAESEKLDYKYQLWAATNAPSGQRGMEDVTDRFGISNLLAFALGGEVLDSPTWFRARVQSVEMTGATAGVWLRAHRRNDLPELVWIWNQSEDLQGFPHTPEVLTNSSSPLGGVMEEWDVRVPLPDSATKDHSFYRLEVIYPNNTP